MKILVTGTAGFIGSNLCEKLILDPKIKIIGLDSLTSYYDPEIKKRNISGLNNYPNFTFVEGSLLDVPLLNSLFSKYKFDKVIHLAAQVGVRHSIKNPTLYYEHNIIGTLNFSYRILGSKS